MASNVLSGKTALVTGASSGLGVDFARELAGYGCNLILVARREDRLRAVQAEIQKAYPVQVEICPLDLTAPGAAEQLYQYTQDLAKNGVRPVDVLINNAGFGIYGEHMSIPWEKEHEMLELDIIVLAQLTKLFLKDMLARNFGYILLVSSIGAYQPSPVYASYSAAKSFVLYFGEALNYELRKTNVGISVISPGVTATEFLQVAGQPPSLYQRLIRMKSADVARIGIRAMLKRRPSVVPGWLNGLMTIAVRLTPRRATAAIAYWLMIAGQKQA